MPTDNSQSPYLHPTPYVPFIPPTGQNQKEAGPHTLSQAIRPEAQRREETHPEGGCQLAAEPRLASGLEILCPTHRPSLSPSPGENYPLHLSTATTPPLPPGGPDPWGLSPRQPKPLHSGSSDYEQLRQPIQIHTKPVICCLLLTQALHTPARR